jgi:hypothetical protein
MSVTACAEKGGPALEEEIMKLMELTGAVSLGEQMGQVMTSQLIESMRRGGLDLPQRGVEITLEVMDEELSAALSGPDSMMEELVAIYAKHYTHEEIKELIAFYESPLGRKVLSTMPVLLAESAEIAQRWSQSIMPRFQEKLRLRLVEEGLIPN